MIDQINELPKDGMKSSPETSRYTESKWISREKKNQNKLYFLHLMEETDSLLHTFVLKKPYFSIFHTNYLTNISPFLKALAHSGCH